MERMTLDEFLGLHGVGFSLSGTSLDKCRFPHGLTRQQHRQMMKSSEKENDAYYEKRSYWTEQYYHLLSLGEIQEKSRKECTMQKAKFGHPDNASVQAARRICQKRNWEWESYDPDTYTEEK